MQSSEISSSSKHEQLHKQWTRLMTFKLSQIDKNLIQQRLQDQKQQSNPMIMKQAKHQGGAASRKPKKFGVMQLQINRAKIEMGRFEKNTQIQEKEQKREDMVLAATQLAIYEAQDIANNKVSKESRKNQAKGNNVLTNSTFFKYKSKSISTEDITIPLHQIEIKRYLRFVDKSHDHMKGFSNLNVSSVNNLESRKNSLIKPQNTNNVYNENQISLTFPQQLALKKLKAKLMQQQEGDNYTTNKETNYRQIQVQKSKGSAFGLVKYRTLYNEEGSQDQSYHLRNAQNKNHLYNNNTNFTVNSKNLEFAKQFNTPKFDIMSSRNIADLMMQNSGPLILSKQKLSLPKISPIKPMIDNSPFTQIQGFSDFHSSRNISPKRIRSKDQSITFEHLYKQQSNEILEDSYQSINLTKNTDKQIKYHRGVLAFPKIAKAKNSHIMDSLNNIISDITKYREDELFKIDQSYMSISQYNQ